MTFKRKPKHNGRHTSANGKARTAGWPRVTGSATVGDCVGTARIAADFRLVRDLAHSPALVSALVSREEPRSKYGNQRCEADGLKFDSRAERSRYFDLKRWQAAGLISDLRLQVPFVIAPAARIDGRMRPARKYVADFVYVQDGETVVEDAKGYRTPEYKLKRHLMAALLGIEVQEV
jgi:hypothetical protein